jgi:predicted dehydrogenase
MECSRVAVGDQCRYGIEIRGDKGALAWDFRRMGELHVCLDQNYLDASWQTRLVTPRDGALGAFQPGAGIAMGYDDLKVVEAEHFVRSIAEKRPIGATIDDMVTTAALIEAITTSCDERRWVAVTGGNR